MQPQEEGLHLIFKFIQARKKKPGIAPGFVYVLGGMTRHRCCSPMTCQPFTTPPSSVWGLFQKKEVEEGLALLLSARMQ